MERVSNKQFDELLTKADPALVHQRRKERRRTGQVPLPPAVAGVPATRNTGESDKPPPEPIPVTKPVSRAASPVTKPVSRAAQYERVEQYILELQRRLKQTPPKDEIWRGWLKGHPSDHKSNMATQLQRINQLRTDINDKWLQHLTTLEY